MTAQILHGPKLTYIIREKTCGSFFFNQCNQYGDRICHIDGTLDKSEIYSSVRERSVRVALELQKRNITSQDVVGICSSNTLDCTIPFIATTFLGAKVTNFESSLSIRHTQHLLSMVEPKVIFVEENALSLIENSLAEINIETEIIVFGNSDKYKTFSSLLNKHPNEETFRPIETDPNDLVILLFSSGSTGLPKAICHSHKTLLKLTEIGCQIGFGDAPFHFTSLYWLTAVIFMACSFAFGSYRIFGRNLTAQDVFEIIQKYKVRTIFAAPVLTYMLTNYDNAHNYDFSSVKHFAVGGTAIAPLQLLKLKQMFEDSRVHQYYGLTEVGFSTAYLSKSDQEATLTNLGTSGKPVPANKIKVVDVITRELLGPNKEGEICIWSPSMMVGYYKLDASSVFDEEGFLKTGDTGYYDNDGFLYIVERIKEMFKYQSWHIVPTSIEAILLEHPGIKEAVVVGLPNDKDGEVPTGCLVLNKGYNLQEDDVDDFLKGKVSDRERLRGGVIVVDNLPRTPTGKIIRSEVKNLILKLKNAKN